MSSAINPKSSGFTSETNQTEWNLAHHFAVEIHKLVGTGPAPAWLPALTII